ncbi:hypothetical protein Sste5346_001804 [Sporothrix stenoceras]|uniref:Uncharacterized protein n=1 Tax=Sporothrix stenoceras TaxID=5173 RepID=A0ABR3ZPF7_9PEZI
MLDHAPSATDADAGAAESIAAETSRPPVTPTTPSSPFTGSFSGSFHAARPSPARSFNIHALGFNTSPLGPLGRRISFYDGESGSAGGSGGDDEDDDEGDSNDDLRKWQTSDDGHADDYNYRLDDPIALEERKDVLIDRLNDVVRHVSSYTPSSPSLSNSNRSASTWNSPAKSASAEAAARPADDGTVLSALHAHIDEMEAVLAAAQAAEAAAAAASPRNRHHHHHHNRHYPWQRPERRSRASTSSVVSEGSPGVQGQAKASLVRRTTLDAAPILFRGQSSSFRGAALPAETKAADTEDNAQPTVAKAVAVNCEVLAGDLSAVLANLLKRRQDSEMIQETLLQKLAAANSRTAELEAQVQALTAAKSQDDTTDNQDYENNDDIDADDDEGTPTETATEKGANDDTIDPVLVDRLADLDDLGSELSFLRLQLRGIEVRCRSYVPVGADPELTESIENWKADWSALRAKVGEERRSTTTSMNTSMSLLDKDNSSNTYNDMNSTF